MDSATNRSVRLTSQDDKPTTKTISMLNSANKPYLSESTNNNNNQTSQDLALSTNEELHWCPDMDYHLSCDNMFRSPKSNNSQISFTLASSDSNSVSKNQFLNNNNNFDIHLAQIDIETFKSEDIRKIRFNQSMNASNDDTLRIVDSINSFTNQQLANDDCEALSIDSLEISIDNSINSELIQKCSQNDKTKYKIAMIDSQMQNSQTNSNNPFSSSCHRFDMMNGSQNIQSPGSLVKMFIQNKINSNENSANANLLFDTKNNNNNNNSNSNDLSKFDNNNVIHQMNGINSFTTEDGNIDESTANSNSLNTIDSNELPLHVLDLSKKLRSLNLNKQLKYGSTSISSSNTSFTSTTTSSSAATDRRKHQQRNPYNNTNPFLNVCHESKITKSAATQFPDMFQDKEVQASFGESDIKDGAPVLVYYPNYSLPDLSFLQEIFHQDGTDVPVYLSPVKHEPVKPKPETNVKRRAYVNHERKCRPKSYTDYETLLNQDLSHIKDWESLNLLLPDDFKEFIKQNNLLNFNKNRSEDRDVNQEQIKRNSNIPLPIKAMIPNNHRLFQNVKFRPHSMQNTNSRTKRYSLQEHNFDQQNNMNYYNYPNPRSEFVNENEIHSFMIRSQTMPNCQMAFNSGCYPPTAHPPGSHMMTGQIPGARAPPYHNCCHTCCHSGCHSPSIHSSQSSPQKPNLNWELLSSSSFKKLLSFLSKLDEYSSHSDSSHTEVHQENKLPPSHGQHKKTTTQNSNNNNNENRSSMAKSHRHKSSNHHRKDIHSSKNGNHQNAQSGNNKNIKTAHIQTKNSTSEKPTKIVLKRPTTLNKNNSNSSGIPVPKRMSSMIPVLKNGSANGTGTSGNQPQSKQHMTRNKNGNIRF